MNFRFSIMDTNTGKVHSRIVDLPTATAAHACNSVCAQGLAKVHEIQEYSTLPVEVVDDP